jgi:uncharacterized membrane protein YkoI
MRYAARFIALSLAGVLATASAGAQKSKPESQAQLMRLAKISKATATRTALKEVPRGKIQSSEIERENGKLIYSFDIKVAGKSGIDEVNVDAMTGAVISKAHETPAAEKQEAKHEKKQ